MTIHYQDERITCDEDGITIDWYHFPFGTEKRIYYTDVEKIEYYSLGFHTGRYKYWGGDFKHWLNLDWKRHNKSTGIVLRLAGKWGVPIITPDNPEAVLKILEEKTGIKPMPEGVGATEGSSDTPKRCTCGTMNDGDAMFCKKCGTQLD